MTTHVLILNNKEKLVAPVISLDAAHEENFTKIDLIVNHLQKDYCVVSLRLSRNGLVFDITILASTAYDLDEVEDLEEISIETNFGIFKVESMQILKS